MIKSPSLSRAQLNVLHRSLLANFDQPQFEALVRERIGAPFDHLVSPGSMAGMTSDIVQAAERAGWTADLVRAAYEARPDIPAFRDLHSAMGLEPEINVQAAGKNVVLEQPPTTAAALEYIIKQPRLQEIGPFRERLGSVEACVCRVETAQYMGTGFLVAPDLVLTAYYCVEDAIKTGDGSRMQVRFDYRVTGDTVSNGVIVRIARGTKENWLVDSSPYSNDERMGNTDSRLPTMDELDYALVRLERPIGAEPMQGLLGPPRGWLKLPEKPPSITPGMTLFIAQFASGGPLKIAMDMQGVIGLNRNGTRLAYATATGPGAGGAPCFNASWEIVAMHHRKVWLDGARSPNEPHGHNEGIPIAAIRKRIIDAGKGSFLTETPELPPPETEPPEPGPIVHGDDPQKERWGGRAERDGRKIRVILKEQHERSTFEFDVLVESTDGSPLRPPVIFHLHDSYPRSKIAIRKIIDSRVATLLEVQSYGVFVIGAQAMDKSGNWVGLEFDLAALDHLAESFKRT